jgi:hypothetical protein
VGILQQPGWFIEAKGRLLQYFPEVTSASCEVAVIVEGVVKHARKCYLPRWVLCNKVAQGLQARVNAVVTGDTGTSHGLKT